MTPKQLQVEYNLSNKEIQKVCIACEMMPDDVDGVYTTLQDENIHIEYEDLSELCELYL